MAIGEKEIARAGAAGGSDGRLRLSHLRHALLACARVDDWDEIEADLSSLGAATRALTFEQAVGELEHGENPSVLLLEVSAGLSEELESELLAKAGPNVPRIALVERETMARLRLPSGVDDFLVLPTSREELALRLERAVGRRAPPEAEHGVRHGDLLIDEERYRVRLAGEPVELTHKEFQLLLYLSSRAGRVCTREAILNRVWGYEFYGGTRTVDVHIRRLRSKIEDAKHSFIETVRNVGYRFHAS